MHALHANHFVVDTAEGFQPDRVFIEGRDQVVLAVRVAPVLGQLDLTLLAAVIDEANARGLSLVREQTVRDEYLLAVFEDTDDTFDPFGLHDDEDDDEDDEDDDEDEDEDDDEFGEPEDADDPHLARDYDDHLGAGYGMAGYDTPADIDGADAAETGGGTDGDGDGAHGDASDGGDAAADDSAGRPAERDRRGGRGRRGPRGAGPGR